MSFGIPVVSVPGFEELGLVAFTTTREAGSFNLSGGEPASAVFGRWSRLREAVAGRTRRLASAHQVHGTRVLEHDGAWEGWLRAPDADGHLDFSRATAMAVSLADCVPIFVAHESGIGGVLHSGWRGTAARIMECGLERFRSKGFAPRDLTVHLGPAICGSCYEVGPEVHLALTGRRVTSPEPVNLRELLAAQAADAGVVRISISEWCTRCHNDRFFSHRAGDHGRQLGVLVTSPRA